MDFATATAKEIAPFVISGEKQIDELPLGKRGAVKAEVKRLVQKAEAEAKLKKKSATKKKTRKKSASKK